MELLFHPDEGGRARPDHVPHRHAAQPASEEREEHPQRDVDCVRDAETGEPGADLGDRADVVFEGRRFAVLEAQSVPSATRLPCLAERPRGMVCSRLLAQSQLSAHPPRPPLV